MANYNSNIFYNRSVNQKGAKYNTIAYVVLFRLTDGFTIGDNEYRLWATHSFVEGTQILSDGWSLNADYKYIEGLVADDSDIVAARLFEIFDEFGVKDLAVELVASLIVNDNVELLEDAKMFAEILARDNINAQEFGTVEAFIEAMDDMGFSELSELFATIMTYDRLNVTDGDPQAAVSDFYVTKDENGLYDLILPFNLIVDYNKTTLPFMPEAVDTSVELAGADGEIVQDTVYKSRVFDIFAVTMDGLSAYEKEQVKKDIATILHSIKKDTKVITFANNETAFDVKYTGLANIDIDAAGWMEFEIPLKSAAAMGHKQFEQRMSGSGLMVNSGSDPVGAIITITGPVDNPGFTLGDTAFSWTGTVPQGSRLVIDMDGQSCYMLDSEGKRTLATKNLQGEYVKIPVGSMVLQANQNTEEHIESRWRELVLY